MSLFDTMCWQLLPPFLSPSSPSLLPLPPSPAGVPVFPIRIGGLQVHSLGKVTHTPLSSIPITSLLPLLSPPPPLSSPPPPPSLSIIDSV